MQQAPVAGEVDVDHLDVGIDPADIVLAGQLSADAAIAALVVDGVDPDPFLFRWIIMQVKQAKLPHQLRAEELRDEAFIAIVGPDVAQDTHRIAASGNVRKPFAIFIRRLANDAFDVRHHRESERIRIEARETRIIEVRLEHHIGMRLQEFEEIPVGNLSLFV